MKHDGVHTLPVFSKFILFNKFTANFNMCITLLNITNFLPNIVLFLNFITLEVSKKDLEINITYIHVPWY